MITCEYCGFGNEDDAGCCAKCGAPRGRAFGKSSNLIERVRNIVSTILPAGVWPVRGVDVSAWNGVMDWVATALRAQFAIIRAGYGNAGIDIKLDRNWNCSTQVNIIPGLYWFVRAGEDYSAHAHSLWTARKNYPGPIPATMDCEYTILSPWDTTNWIYSMLCTYEDLAGESPMIYTSPGWWNTNTVATKWASTLNLWNAHWTNALTPLLPSSWTAANIPWTFWQWSADNNGLGRLYGSTDGDADMDLDRYNGTVDDFNARFHTSIKPLPETIPAPVDEVVPIKTVTVTASALNVRSRPDASSSKIGMLYQSTQVPVTKENGDWYHVEGWINRYYTK